MKFLKKVVVLVLFFIGIGLAMSMIGTGMVITFTATFLLFLYVGPAIMSLGGWWVFAGAIYQLGVIGLMFYLALLNE